MFSTGNVYPLTPLDAGGARERCAASLGEYAMSCLGRERLWGWSPRSDGTPVAIVRLNYACATALRRAHRPGAARVDREPVDVTMGAGERDLAGRRQRLAAARARASRGAPFVGNVTGAQTLRVRDPGRRAR